MLRQLFALLLLGVLCLAACKRKDDDGAGPSGPEGPTRQGRQFSIYTYPAQSNDWLAAGQFTLAEKADWLLLSPQWADLDSAGTLRMADIRNLATWLTLQGRPATLAFGNTRPRDLDTLPYDAPAVVARMNTLLDSLRAVFGPNQLHALFVGHDVGEFLGNDAAKWAQFKNLVQAVAQRAHALWGSGLRVGSVGNFYHLLDATLGPRFRDLYTVCDVVAAQYYPLNADFTMAPLSRVRTDLDVLVGGFAGKPIYLMGVGYSSSTGCGGSDSLQAAFMRSFFDAWDAHAAAIPAVGFAPLHDANPADVDTFIVRSGLTGHIYEGHIRAFFGNLGLRTRAGTGANKPAMEALRQERDRRGW